MHRTIVWIILFPLENTPFSPSPTTRSQGTEPCHGLCPPPQPHPSLISTLPLYAPITPPLVNLWGCLLSKSLLLALFLVTLTPHSGLSWNFTSAGKLSLGPTLSRVSLLHCIVFLCQSPSWWGYILSVIILSPEIRRVAGILKMFKTCLFVWNELS